jgi:virginiamycin B lyase
MATGQDGAVWFSTGTTLVGRITPGGELSTFDTVTTDPPDMSPPVYLAAGPDGQMWFTSFGDLGGMAPRADVVGKISGDGKVTKVVLPNATSETRGILALTTGPDGNVWITTDSSGTVLRMAPDFSFSEFKVSDKLALSSSVSIVSGPDGNLWMTGYGLQRITPDGDVTNLPFEGAYPSDQFPESPVDITVGPDRALWFITDPRLRIGRITVDGMDGYVTPYTLDFTYSEALGSPVAGPDGNLWFSVGDGVGYYEL